MFKKIYIPTFERRTNVLTTLFSEGVITEEADPQLIEEILYPAEEDFIKNAVPKRKQEFIAGRLCARRALAKLGIRDFPLINGIDRCPIWPSEIIGSISHTARYCAVALARKEQIRGIGLDIESIDKITDDCLPYICYSHEVTLINSYPQDMRQTITSLIFSAKECFYKCQYPITKQWAGFHDVEISIDSTVRGFKVHLIKDIGDVFLKKSSFNGYFMFHRDYVITGMTLMDL